jgi:hypothetical protein
MKAKIAALLLALAFLSGCTGKEATVVLQATVKTNQGDPVQGAVISMDGKAIGETNLQGIFETKVNVPVGVKKKIEVKKESEAYYFAPYYESFTLADSAPQELALSAVLYFVPKPASGDKTSDVATVPPAAEVKTETPSEAPAETSIAETDVVSENTEPEVAGQTPTPVTPEVVAEKDPAVVAPDPLASIQEEDLTNEDDLVADEDKAAKVKALAEEEKVDTNIDEQEVINAQTVSVPIEPVGIPAATMGPPSKIEPANALKHVGESLFTVHVFQGKTPVKDAAISYGLPGGSDLKDACKTNDRGRCVIRFIGYKVADVTLVASKSGFKTLTKSVTFEHKGKIQLQIEKGHTLDIYALVKNYNYKNGIKDAEVFINGKSVGKTDSFGKYSYLYEGKKEDLVAVSIKAKGHLPEVFETDFIASDSMNLVKFFAPEIPPPAKVVVLTPKIAGAADAVKISMVNGDLDQRIRHSTSQSLFSTSAFLEYPQALFDSHLKTFGAGSGDILSKGWSDLEAKKLVDVLLVPTVVFEDKIILELSMVDSKGVTVAAAKETLDDANDGASINRAVADIAKKVIRAFPFEGAVLSKNGNAVNVNLGFASGRGVKSGDILDVYGLQVEKHGRSKAFGKIATLVVKEVVDAEARTTVQQLEPRSTIERGDIVSMRVRRPTTVNSAQVRVSTNKSGKESEIAGANVYFNETWIGSTGSDGRLYAEVTGTGTLKVIKQGFAPFNTHVGMRSGVRHDVTLKAQSAYLRVDSQPQGAKVTLDGAVVGITPINTPVAAKVGFVKLQVEGPEGFKTYSQVLELDEGTLDLTGARAITLEQNVLNKALALKTAGKLQEAAAAFAAVPTEHSDYLSAQHELGQIFLMNLNMPARAAEAFGKITATENVKNFSDKRFIGSHINEGIAVFQTAERLVNEDPTAAQAHYRKAIAIFENIIPHLRHVPSAQYNKAVHNVDYYKALAKHRLWNETKDPTLLSDALKTWKSYIDGSARSVPVQNADKAFVDNAQVYYRQALASYNNGKNAVKQ